MLDTHSVTTSCSSERSGSHSWTERHDCYSCTSTDEACFAGYICPSDGGWGWKLFIACLQSCFVRNGGTPHAVAPLAALLRLRRHKAKCVKNRCLQEGVDHLEPRFQGKGSSSRQHIDTTQRKKVAKNRHLGTIAQL